MTKSQLSYLNVLYSKYLLYGWVGSTQKMFSKPAAVSVQATLWGVATNLRGQYWVGERRFVRAPRVLLEVYKKLRIKHCMHTHKAFPNG